MKLELSKEEAREIYSLTKDERVRRKLEANFSKEELGVAPTKPKCWEDLGEIKGYWVDGLSDVEQIPYGSAIKKNKNIFATKEQAVASSALAQLSQLMIHPYWNGDWKPDWTSEDELKAVIFPHSDSLIIHSAYYSREFLAFKTKGKAEEFLESYRDLIEQAKPLL